MVHPEDGPRVGPGHNFPSAAPSLLDDKRRWWPQLRPSLGRRALPCCALRKWRKLLVLLRSITLDVAVLRSMFKRVQYAFKRVVRRHVQITADVHDELDAWRKLVCSLASSPTHLRKLEPFSSTWVGTTNASGSVMGGVCQDTEGKYFVWRYPFSLTT